jgi:hypothetical protein
VSSWLKIFLRIPQSATVARSNAKIDFVEPIHKLAYADHSTRPRWSKQAIASFVAGILSGPVGVAATLAISDLQVTEGFKELWGLSAFALCILIPFLMGIICSSTLAYNSQLRGRRLAIAGAIASVVWLIIIVVFIYIAMQYGT